MTSYLYSVVVKTVASGQNCCRVPVLSVSPITFTGYSGIPRSYSCWYIFPSRNTCDFIRLERALTQLTPTPCRPPLTLYEPLSNLPPACSTVITTSSADLCSFLCSSTGIPRPLSCTVIELSSFIVTSMCVQYPAIASSMELSTVSFTKWCKPLSEMSPIYIAGRLRTASRPSNTCMLLAE